MVRADSGTAQKQRALLIKTDSLGNELWQKTYKFNAFAHYGESIALCADGGFIISGSEKDYSSSHIFVKPLVIKVDSMGNVQWHKTYGSTDFSNKPAYGITQCQDGGYAFVGGVGTEIDFRTSFQAPWVVKINALGFVMWADTNNPQDPNKNDNYYTDIIELSDGSLVACGQRNVWDTTVIEPAKNRLNGVLVKYNKQGVVQWTRNHRHPETVDLWSSLHFLYDIKPTSDGGFVAIGFIHPTLDSTQSTWVIKVDSFGCLEPGCEVTSVPKIHAPITQLKIYPNPANEILNIEITPSGNQQTFEFGLYDLLGKRVLSQVLFTQNNTLDISHLPAGMYTYKIDEVWGQIIVK